MKPAEIHAAFVQALEIDAGTRRRDFLERTCDPTGLAEVERLLTAWESTGSFFQPAPSDAFAIDSAEIAQHLAPPPAGPDSAPGGTPAPGTSLGGRYTLVEQVGQGGMGTVWRAEQLVPVRRMVAVKLLNAGMDSDKVVARFEAERQALALMDHPNIARIFDAGMEGNRPFFAMELVKGTPITQYCDEHRLSPKQRLELFVSVCAAIQHAHQKGIIHRDIKPSNVLVAPYDGRPFVKVIDFGIAKATGQRLTDSPMQTEIGAIVGTLEYMSPEQADLDNQDIDTRSDIYSLGVLLYEMLTGSTPLNRKSLKVQAILEMLRIVREVEPPRPSTRLSTDDALPSISAQRLMDPAKLTRFVKGELDWIVMKSLEKDRNRRYESANGFAMDIQRYLAGEAVQAYPPSAGYRMRKFVRRNKGQVIAASLVLLALFAGVIGTSIGMVKAENRRIEAEQARAAEAERAEGERQAKLDAQRKTAIAEAANAQALKRLTQIEKGSEVITSIFEDLDLRAVKERKELLEVVLAKRLVAAAGQLEGEAVGDPLVVAGLQHHLGVSLINLGDAPEAIPLYLKSFETRSAALGADHPDTIASMNSLAVGYKTAGKLDRAMPLFEESLRLQTAKLGIDHPDTLQSMHNLAFGYKALGKLDKALPLYEEAFKLRKAKLGADDLSTLTSMNNLALAYQAAGNLDRALPLFEEALELRKAKFGPDNSYTLISMSNLAMAYRSAGKFDKAMPLFEETLKLTAAKMGADHPDTFQSMNNLAMGYKAVGKIDRALPLYEETFKLRKAKLGADHPDTLQSMNNLASAYTATEKFDEALTLYGQVLEIVKSKLGADHPSTLTTMANLAVAYGNVGKLDKALPLFEEAFKLQTAKLGANHPSTLQSMTNLAGGYKAAGKLDKALPLFEQALELRKAKLGADHPDTLQSLNRLASCYEAVGKLDRALPLYEEAAAGLEKRQFKVEKAGSVIANLIDCYERLRQFDRAEAWRRKWLAAVKERSGAESLPYAGELAALGSYLITQQKWADAEAALRECLAIRAKAQPDIWTTFDTRSTLGEALLGEKKFAEAEPLLLEGYAGMKQRERAIPPPTNAILAALDRLIALYTAINRPDEARKWQVEKAKHPEVLPKPREVK